MLEDLKKIELHLHLDGSVRFDTIKELYGNIKEDDVIATNSKNLEEYLTKFDIPIKIMQTKENLVRITKELVEDLIADNVIYAEIRFAPIMHANNLELDEVVDSVLLGIKDSKIEINLILCMMRYSSFEDNLKIINLTQKYLNKGVGGIDLAGDEFKYKTKEFKKLFDIINKKNIPFTIHSGEADGIESIMDSISFKTKRIGHGIRCVENKYVMDIIKQNKITLEVCPTSNIDTKICEYKNHPIKELFDNDILVTINTDNRTVSNITLTEEYYKLNKYFGFTKNDFLKMNINAVNASFSKNKEKLIKKLLN